MMIILIFWILLFVGLFIFIRPIRNSVINFLQATGYIIGGAWHQMPTRQEIYTFLTTLYRITIGPMLSRVIIAWGFFGIASCILGYLASSEWAGFFIGIFFPIWMFLLLLSILDDLPGFGFLFRWSRRIAGLVITISFLFVTFGVVSPEIKIELSRWIDNRKLEIANFLGKKSLQSEPEAGIFAIVSKDVMLLNDDGLPTIKVEANTMVMVDKDLTGRRASRDSEGKIRIMVPDWYGHYDKGRSGWIPSRILEFNIEAFQEKKAKEEREEKERRAEEERNKPPANSKLVRCFAPPVEPYEFEAGTFQLWPQEAKVVLQKDWKNAHRVGKFSVSTKQSGHIEATFST